MTVEIQGRCHPKFARVRDAFAKKFADGNEVGASLCLTLEGETVVSFGYVMNLMHTGLWLVDPRPRRLLAAAYASL